MTVVRVAAGTAALITAFLLQATVFGPLSAPLPVSLPAVLVAAIAVREGPAAGVSLGFAGGLLADLTSDHPLGLLALAWLGLGLVAGRCGGILLVDVPASLRRGSPAGRKDGRLARTLRAATGVGAAAGATGFLVAMVLAGLRTQVAPLPGDLLRALVAVPLDVLLALAVLPLTGSVLRSPAVRPAAGPLPRIGLGTR